MEDLDALLDRAKERLASSKPESSDIMAKVDRIPKLKTGIETTTIAGLEPSVEFAQQRPLKAVPTAEKPIKQDTAGSKWFDMGMPRMTPQLKRDLQLLQMRHALDPKRFYKRESAAPSKYFQVGTIKESPTEFYSARLTKKERKATLAEEILSTRQDYFKSRYKTIQKSKQSGRKKHVKKLKDMRA